jgi:hypothetical protein
MCLYQAFSKAGVLLAVRVCGRPPICERPGKQGGGMAARQRAAMPGDPQCRGALEVEPASRLCFRATPKATPPSPAHELEIFLRALFTYCFLHCRARLAHAHKPSRAEKLSPHAVTTQILLALARGGYSLTTHKIPSIVRVSNRSPAPAHSRALLPARLALQLLVYR